jgi:hypothetical protein
MSLIKSQMTSLAALFRALSLDPRVTPVICYELARYSPSDVLGMPETEPTKDEGMLPPNLNFLINAGEALMRAALVLFVFGLLVTAVRAFG